MLRNRDSASVMQMTQLATQQQQQQHPNRIMMMSKRRENDSISSADSGTVVGVASHPPVATTSLSSAKEKGTGSSAVAQRTVASPSSNMFIHGDVIWSQLQGKQLSSFSP